jgi:hypothetical protein
MEVPTSNRGARRLRFTGWERRTFACGFLRCAIRPFPKAQDLHVFANITDPIGSLGRRREANVSNPGKPCRLLRAP